MSRYGGPDYHRDRRERSPARFTDRRASYNEPPRAPRLRDAPPLGRNPRDSRDFPPRDGDSPRPRRNSRDGPLSAGASYPEGSNSFRGGFGRGRGRGDTDFRAGRGGRRIDDRDSYTRDRSPPPRWSREDRSPPRRDDRRFDRRDDMRRADTWSERDRDRDSDRWRDSTAPAERRMSADNQLSNAQPIGGIVNPDRLALIEDSHQDLPPRRASTFNVPPTTARSREQSDVPPYLSARSENVSNKYSSRASSPPAQIPSVPAFGLSFAPPPPVKPDIKVEAASLPNESSSTHTGAQSSPILAKDLKLTSTTQDTDPTALAPRAPKAHEGDQPGDGAARLHSARSWESLSATSQQRPVFSQSTSPVMHTSSRPGDAIPPTGPKATRTLSHTSQTSQPRSRTPPLSAPSGPRSHAASRSPDVTFASIPSGPRTDRMPAAARAQDRPAMARLPPTAPRSQQQGWNSWRRDAIPTAVAKREPDQRADQVISGLTTYARAQPDTAKRPASPPKGHSAQQSFFGQPATDKYDDAASDLADDSISSSDDDDDIEVEDLALFEAKFKRKERELEAKLIDLSAREYRATTPLATIARLATITMKDVERFKEREIEMDVDESTPVRRRIEPPTAPSSRSEDSAGLPTPTGEENTSVLIHADDDAEEDLRRIFRPPPEAISLPYLNRGGPLTDMDFRTPTSINTAVVDAYKSKVAQETDDMQKLADTFEEKYKAWRLQCEELDFEREQQEALERQQSLEPGPEPDLTPSTTSNPTFEGRRRHGFVSEYDMQQILKESEDMARVMREKAEREARRWEVDLEKEAVVPDQLTPKAFLSQSFVDENRLRAPESLTRVFAYEPAEVNFSLEEQQIFSAAFKETPKKWTEIASLLPGREPRDCIRHYYASKWDGRYKDKQARGFKGKRKASGKNGRSRASAMADLGGLDDAPVQLLESGRPKRAAAPTTFAEKETEAKTMLSGQSPAKRANVKQEGLADADKPNKRRKPAGEKSTRKPKTTQPLATIAAAPILSPEGRTMQLGQPREVERSRLEDASLLTGFYAGRPGLPGEQPAAFGTSDKFMPRLFEEHVRVPVQASSSKPSPSSYWSVPEQGDFLRYIAYFGTDFAAIAAHMGTKTQTMIKNHYQRQIEGSHPELEKTANAANAARSRGETVGAPPTPTPITKRKYDSATTMPSRNIVPLDPMDIDEPVGRQAQTKHESPHQFSSRPQYPPTTMSTPQSSHAGPSLSAQDHSIMAANAPSRTFQPRPSIFQDARGEARTSISGAPSYYPPASAALGQPAPQRAPQDSHEAYIRGLREEQQRAIRLQDQNPHDLDHIDPYYQRANMQHRSPPAHPMHLQQHERRPLVDHRPHTPPAAYYSARSTPNDPARNMGDRSAYLLDSNRFPQPNAQAMPSPPKRDPLRPAPPASTFSSSASNKPATAASEAPKRMDLFSMLNTTEDPKPKRNSLDVPPPRTASPSQHSGLAASPYSSLSKPREQYSQPQASQYSARPSMSHMPAPARSPNPPAPLKDPMPSGMPAKQEWPHRSSVSSQPAPPFEREVRPYYTHRSSVLGQGDPARVGPSPPPHPTMQHSRTPSTAEGPSRGFANPASSGGQSMYGAPPYTHAGSIAGTTAHTQAYAPMHQRGLSREDSYREQLMRESEREREEREWRYQRDRDETQRQRLEAERRHEHDRHYARATPSAPLQQQPASYSMPYESTEARMPSASLSLHEQSAREAEMAMQQQQQAERMRHGTVYGGREREQPPGTVDDARRRHDDAFLPASRRTPLGGGYGPPGMSGQGRR